MKPDRKLLDELVRKIVVAVHPNRIILFGSAAHDRMGPDSDLDVLVVMPDGVHRRKTAQKIYQQLFGFGFAKDIIVATQTDVKIHADNPAMVYRQALTQGKEIYYAKQ